MRPVSSCQAHTNSDGAQLRVKHNVLVCDAVEGLELITGRLAQMPRHQT